MERWTPRLDHHDHHDYHDPHDPHAVQDEHFALQLATRRPWRRLVPVLHYRWSPPQHRRNGREFRRWTLIQQGRCRGHVSHCGRGHGHLLLCWYLWYDRVHHALAHLVYLLQQLESLRPE